MCIDWWSETFVWDDFAITEGYWLIIETRVYLNGQRLLGTRTMTGKVSEYEYGGLLVMTENTLLTVSYRPVTLSFLSV